MVNLDEEHDTNVTLHYGAFAPAQVEISHLREKKDASGNPLGYVKPDEIIETLLTAEGTVTIGLEALSAALVR